MPAENGPAVRQPKPIALDHPAPFVPPSVGPQKMVVSAWLSSPLLIRLPLNVVELSVMFVAPPSLFTETGGDDSDPHRAMRLAARPPAVVKLPPANRLPLASRANA